MRAEGKRALEPREHGAASADAEQYADSRERAWEESVDRFVYLRILAGNPSLDTPARTERAVHDCEIKPVRASMFFTLARFRSLRRHSVPMPAPRFVATHVIRRAAGTGRRHRPRTRSTSSAVHAAAAAAPWSTARRAMPRAVSCTAVRSKPCRPPARTYRHDVLYHAGGKGAVSRGALEALQATGAGGQREEFRWA